MSKASLTAIVLISIFIFTSCNQQSKNIFNGNDLSNWEFVVENNSVPGNEVYSVEDGIITVKGEPLGYMYTKEKYDNYTLELEYRWIEEASNSGVFVLIEDPANPFPRGVECQLRADRAGDLVLLNGAELNEYELPEGVTERPKFPVIEKKNQISEKPVGEWNKVKIIVNEGVITVYINDILQNSATSEVREGHIGLQSEGKAIQFRNIKI